MKQSGSDGDVDFLKNPKNIPASAVRFQRRLLVGPPGTGKTLLAKPFAGEAQVPSSASAEVILWRCLWVGASRVRDLFKQVREKAPCIIFIDELMPSADARGKI